MTKIGVGVGEEFPIEDKPGQESGAGRTSGENRRDDGYGCGPDSYEDWCDWREERRARRAEWRARRREWRRRCAEERRMRYGPGDPYYYYWGLPRILRIVLVVAAIMLIFRVLAEAPFIILGLGLLAVLYAVHRHHEDVRYREDMPPPPPMGGN